MLAKSLLRMGGLVALVAPTVRNTGVIRARLGKAHLASGDAFTIDLYGDRLVQLQIAEGSPGSESLVSNAGEVYADGGIVQLTAATARTALDGVINVSGAIRATSIADSEGEIVLLGEDAAIVLWSPVVSTPVGSRLVNTAAEFPSWGDALRSPTAHTWTSPAISVRVM